MNVGAIRTDALYLLRTYVRSPMSLVSTLAIPVVLFVLLGSAFDPAHDARAHVAVADLDDSPASRDLVGRLSSLGTLDVTRPALPLEADADAWLKRAGLDALLEIPQGYGAAGGNATLRLRVPEGDGFRGGLVRASIASAMEESPPVLDVRTFAAAAPVPYSSFLLPGLVGMNVLSIGLITSFSSVAELRAKGLLARYALSPMSKADWLVARMLAQTIIACFSSAVLVLVAIVLFRTHVTVSPVTLLLIAAGTMLFAGLGASIAGLIHKMEAASMVLNLVFFPLILLSGSFFEATTLPAFLRFVPRLSPLAYLNDGLRSDMVLGDSAGAFVSALVLLGLSLLVVLLGARLIRWNGHD